MKKLLALFLFAFAAFAHAQAAPQLTLTWDYNAADITKWGITGFQVQRKAEACAGPIVFGNHVVVGAPLRTYVDTGVVPGTTYCYRVFAMAPITALNPQGNSGFSNTAEKLVLLGPPPPPANLLISFISALIDALENLKTGLLDLK